MFFYSDLDHTHDQLLEIYWSIRGFKAFNFNWTIKVDY